MVAQLARQRHVDLAPLRGFDQAVREALFVAGSGRSKNCRCVQRRVVM
jgi:hypothetical protein